MSSSLKRRRGSDSTTEATSTKWTTLKDHDLAHYLTLSTKLLGHLTNEQKEAYIILFRIEEINQKLRHPDRLITWVPPRKGPPPEPIYDDTGKRVNTPQYLYSRDLEKERDLLIENAIRAIPGYVPPPDYKHHTAKIVDKVWIPAEEYPEINFIGLLLGPRGKTLRMLEEKSGALIQIRGLGSVKEGRNRTLVLERAGNMTEKLHCLVTGTSPETLQRGVAACKDIINRAVLTPEGQNELKRGQLRELAAINGTLRDYLDRPCPRCGEVGHRKYDCPNQQQFAESVVCAKCGSVGHFARDCRAGQTVLRADEEFEQMMQEIGGKPPALKRRKELPSPGDLSLQESYPVPNSHIDGAPPLLPPPLPSTHESTEPLEQGQATQNASILPPPPPQLTEFPPPPPLEDVPPPPPDAPLPPPPGITEAPPPPPPPPAE